LFGTHPRGRFVADTPICSIADTTANRQAVPLFLPAAKRREGTSEPRKGDWNALDATATQGLDFRALRHMYGM
jgi:hypothetical protein